MLFSIALMTLSTIMLNVPTYNSQYNGYIFNKTNFNAIYNVVNRPFMSENSVTFCQFNQTFSPLNNYEPDILIYDVTIDGVNNTGRLGIFGNFDCIYYSSINNREYNSFAFRNLSDDLLYTDDYFEFGVSYNLYQSTYINAFLSLSINTTYDLSFSYGTLNLGLLHTSSDTEYLTYRVDADFFIDNDIGFREIADDVFDVYYSFYLYDEETFDFYQNHNLYETYYNNGYADGVQSGNSSYYETGYDVGFDDGRAVGEQIGFADGVEFAMNEDGHIAVIFANILNVALLPVNVFLTILNFEVFGINIGGFVSGLLTVAIVVIIIQSFTGGKKSD